MYPCRQISTSGTRSRGFTLVELLIVIAIISILMTVGVIGIGGMTGGKSVSTATANAEAFFDEARALAVGNNTRARVLVDMNPTKPTYLRRLLIVSESLNASGVPLTNTWTLSSRGLTLPTQVFFSQDYSKKDHSAGAALDPPISLTGPSIKTDYQGNYAYYEFNSEGICTTPGASFIIGQGARPANAAKPFITASAKRDFGGFVIWRNGRMSAFKSPDQMGIIDGAKNF